MAANAGDEILLIYKGKKVAIESLKKKSKKNSSPDVLHLKMVQAVRENEFADLATFLASEKACYVNGQSIAINGAYLNSD